MTFKPEEATSSTAEKKHFSKALTIILLILVALFMLDFLFTLWEVSAVRLEIGEY